MYIDRITMQSFVVALAFLVSLLTTTRVEAEDRFSDVVGPVSAGENCGGPPYQIPYIFWGGDVATFHANGGLTTQKGSIFEKLGLSIKLVPGDDVPGQVRDYMSCKSAFLRLTSHMAGFVSEVTNANPKTRAAPVFQLTWSRGDYLVGRKNIRRLEDLRGKTGVMQKDGPHPGFLDDLLKAAKLTWNDLHIIWVKDITGPNGPEAYMRQHPEVDFALVVTPDMIKLTGGAQNVGEGGETVEGAHVVTGTPEFLRSIADKYYVRSDFASANPEFVEKFTAGYLKAVEEMLAYKADYEAKGSKEYTAILKLAQSIYGKSALETLDDAHGLISDALFVGHPGNVDYFTNKNNLHGNEAMEKAALDLAVDRGYVKRRLEFGPNSMDWNSKAFIGYLAKTERAKTERFRAEAVQEEIEAFTRGDFDDKTILGPFTINFEPNQTDFSAEQFADTYMRAIGLMDKASGAVLTIRGHSDPTATLSDLVQAGLSKGVITRTGSPGRFKYFLNGKEMNLTSTEEVVRLIESGAFDGDGKFNPRETMTSAQGLSRDRANEVKKSIMDYAKKKKIVISENQIQTQGVGIREPVVPKPSNMGQAKENMRVEFRLVRVKAEAMNQSDFDF